MVDAISAIGAIDEEDNNVPAVSGYAPYCSVTPKSQSYPFISQSTLNRSKPTTLSSLFSKPKLKTPSALFSVIQTHKLVTDSHRNSAIIQKDELQGDIDELDNIEKQMIEELRARCEQEKNYESWNTLGRIATFVGSAASFVLGMSLLSSGSGASMGYFLIASGGLGLFGEVMKENGWEIFASYLTSDLQLQKKVANFMHNSMLVLSLGLGLYGMGAAYKGGIFAISELSKTEQVAKVINTASIAIRTLVRVMENYAEYKILKHEAILTDNRGNRTFLETSIKELTSDFQEENQAIISINDAMKKIINNQPVIN